MPTSKTSRKHDGMEIEMNFAERFSNMLLFTNNDVEMRRELAKTFEPHMRNTLGTPDVACIVFNDDSMFMSIRDEMITTEDAKESDQFLHWFLDNEPDVAVPFVNAMIEKMKAVFGENLDVEAIAGSV